MRSTTPPDLFGSMLRAGARRSPDRVLYSMAGGGSITYREADGRASRLANALLGSGMAVGDRIAVWSEDCIEYLEVYLAAARAGLVVVPVNARFTSREAAALVDDAGASALVVSERLVPAADEAFSAGDFRVVVAIGKERALGARAFEEVLAGGSEQDPPAPDEDDVLVIAYTSGTTGKPKGAMLTHRSIKNLARVHAAAYRLPVGSVGAYTGSMSFPATVPAFAASHLFVGGTLHLLGRWDLELALDTVEAHRANWMYVPSPAVTEFATAVAERPRALESLVSVLHSASKVSSDRMAELGAVIGSRLVEGWGLTENSGGLATATTVLDYERLEADDIYGSVGRPTVDSEVRIVDAEGQDVPADGGTVGEVAIRTAALMKGYWKQPEATASAIRDGWYHSGDLGYMDAAGYVYISDRRTDLIVSGGMNVYPSEVEAVISTLPGVTGCAVVGVPDDRWGQAVAAVVEASGGLTGDDVIAHVRAHLASYKKPTRVEFVRSLPRTVSDKVRRQAVRDQLLGLDRA